MCTSKKLSNFEHAVYLRHAFIKIILFIITLGLIYFDFGTLGYELANSLNYDLNITIVLIMKMCCGRIS